jgi:hypothetical protein
MALTTVNRLKTVWLNDQSSANDTRLAALITQAESIINNICRQPVTGQSVAYDFVGSQNRTHILHYTVPVVLASIQSRNNPYDSWTTITGPVVFSTGGVKSLYKDDSFTDVFYRANLTVGYDGTTHVVPAALEEICCEMVVDLLKMTDFGGRENRFGVSSIAVNQGGMTQTTVYKDLTTRFRQRLLPYTTMGML